MMMMVYFCSCVRRTLYPMTHPVTGNAGIEWKGQQTSRIIMSTEEFTKIMHGCAEYEKAAVETLREHCPYFKYTNKVGVTGVKRALRMKLLKHEVNAGQSLLLTAWRSTTGKEKYTTADIIWKCLLNYTFTEQLPDVSISAQNLILTTNSTQAHGDLAKM